MANIITEQRRQELELMQKQLRDLDNFIQRILDGTSTMVELAQYLHSNSQNLNTAMNSGLFALLRTSKILSNEDINRLLRDSISPIERLIRCIIGEEELTILTLPEEEVITKILEEALTPKQLCIINYRYGMFDGKPKTLESSGRHFGITSVRVKQIETNALRKLREPKWLKMLLPDYDLRIKELQETRAMINARESLNLELQSAKAAVNVNELYPMDIKNLNLSVRAYNCLHRARKDTIGAVAELKISDLLRIRNMGVQSMQEVVDAMKNKYDIIIEDDTM